MTKWKSLAGEYLRRKREKTKEFKPTDARGRSINVERQNETRWVGVLAFGAAVYILIRGVLDFPVYVAFLASALTVVGLSRALGLRRRGA